MVAEIRATSCGRRNDSRVEVPMTVSTFKERETSKPVGTVLPPKQGMEFGADVGDGAVVADDAAVNIAAGGLGDALVEPLLAL